jgi:hypothetical protein
MFHLPKGVIHLANSSNENVGSDVEEAIWWDRSLPLMKTFQMAVLILSSRKCESPILELLQKILLMFIADRSCNYCLKRRMPHATAFENIQAACKVGCKTEGLRKKK